MGRKLKGGVMRGFKQYFKIFILAAGLFIIVGYSVFAQEKPIETYYPRKSKEECLKNFDINKVELQDSKLISYIPLLVEYFQCRAVVWDDINECDNLGLRPDYVATCRSSFNEYHGFFGRLLNEGDVNPQTLTSCINNFGLNREDCRLFGQAFLANYTSFCEKFRDNRDRYNECKATISGDDRLCKTDPCRNKATYIKAIKTSDIKECENIKGHYFEKVKMMCQGFISRDEKICQKNKGFAEFRNKYCE